MASLVVLALLVLFCLAAFPIEHFMGIDPDATDLLSRYDPPSADHWLGTDDAGRDELVRLMVGGQVSLLIGLLATFFGGVIGLIVGIVAGYFGGRIDGALMRFTDGIIVLPLLPLLIVLEALDLTKLGFSTEFAHSGAAGVLADHRHHLDHRLDGDRAARARRDDGDCASATMSARRARAVRGRST